MRYRESNSKTVEPSPKNKPTRYKGELSSKEVIVEKSHASYKSRYSGELSPEKEIVTPYKAPKSPSRY